MKTFSTATTYGVVSFFCFMLIGITSNAQSYILKDDGMSGYTPSSIYEDANALIGIGTTVPNGRFHVRGSSYADAVITADYYSGLSPAPDYFLAQHFSIGGPPGFVETHTTDFIIKNTGAVGIGTASPSGLLNIKTNSWNPSSGDIGPVVFEIDNADGNAICQVTNNGTTSGAVGGTLFMIANNDAVLPAFVVANPVDGYSPFSVAGDGTVVLGIDITGSDEPMAQFDLRKQNDYDYIFNIGTAVSNNPLLRIDNSGHIGVGVNPTSGSTLLLKGASGSDTHLDLIAGSGDNKAIRFMGSSTSQVRHVITEDDGDLLIDPGIADGGGNDRLKITGDVQIGTDKPATSTFINSTSGEHNLSVNGWIVSKKVMVETSDWADKVFAEDYKLTNLQELEAFVKEHKHLPEVPSEAQVTTEGINVGDMNRILLQKIEELTLYIIEQQKQIDELNKK